MRPIYSTRQNQKHSHPNEVGLAMAASSDSALPIFAIVVLTVMVSAFLFIAYFSFVTKCCSRSHFLNPLSWLSILRPSHSQDPFIALSPTTWNRGLHESIIRGIPTFQFVKGRQAEHHQEGNSVSVYGCVVCLSEFQEQDMLKVLPNCTHAFHLDCIDIWLQSNANCPLCRSTISGTAPSPLDHIIAPSSSPQDSQLLSNMGSDEDFVVIELGGGEDGGAMLPQRQQDRNEGIRGSLVQPQNRISQLKKPRKWQHASIMGDECIDVRKKDEQFCVQPLRRSFSMDSANDRQVYLDVRAITQLQNRSQNEASASEDSNSRGRRSFFPFRYGRGSKNAVLPLENEV